MKKLILISLLISASVYAQESLDDIAVRDVDHEWQDDLGIDKFSRYDMIIYRVEHFAKEHYADESKRCEYLKAAKTELDRLVDLPNDCN